MKWYNKYNRQQKTGNLNCPQCDYQYIEEMAYFISPYNCPKCNCELAFFASVVPSKHPYIYIINLKNCPSIINNIFNYLSKKNNIENNRELQTLLDMISEVV